MMMPRDKDLDEAMSTRENLLKVSFEFLASIHYFDFRTGKIERHAEAGRSRKNPAETFQPRY